MKDRGAMVAATGATDISPRAKITQDDRFRRKRAESTCMAPTAELEHASHLRKLSMARPGPKLPLGANRRSGNETSIQKAPE
jgi:hypothetical protein